MRRNLRWMLVMMVGLLATYQAFVRGTVLPVPIANLVQNGSFEDGYPGDNLCGSWWHEVGYNCEPTGTIIPGWTETADGVDWHNLPPFPLEPVAQDGSYLIDLMGGGNGRIEQDVPTTEGGVYTLSFSYAIHSVCNVPGSATASAAAGTASLLLVPSAGAFSPTDWEQGSLNFAGAAGPTTTISFQNITGGGCGGVVIDNVSVEQSLPTTADQCKNDGWQSFGVFKNQGDCVSFVVSKK